MFCFIFYVDGFMAIYSIYSLLVLDSGFQQVRFIFHGLHCHGFCKFPFPMLGMLSFMMSLLVLFGLCLFKSDSL